MTAVTREELEDGARLLTSMWWLVLATGIAWFVVALVVLRFDTTSVGTVGVLVGLVLLGSAATEILEAMVVPSWRWAHALLGGLFVVGGIWALINPGEAFWSLAAILGFLLVLKGTVDILVAVESRPVNPIWGLGLATGILEVLLGFWASQQYFPARAALILVWVGFMALFRGTSQIVISLQLRHAHKELSGA